MSKLKMLQPRIRTMGSPLDEWKKAHKNDAPGTLKAKQQANGRTLALNGAAWRTLRAAVLREQPVCALCRSAAATEVDHRDDDPTNNDRANLSALCKPCHSRKTNGDMGHNVKHGCDDNGMPLDLAHPWNAQKSPGTAKAEPTGYPSFSPNRKEQP